MGLSIPIKSDLVAAHVPNLPQLPKGYFRPFVASLADSPLALVIRFEANGGLPALLEPYPEEVKAATWAAIATRLAVHALPHMAVNITGTGVHESQTETLTPAGEQQLARLRAAFSRRAYGALADLQRSLEGMGGFMEALPGKPGRLFRRDGPRALLCNDWAHFPSATIQTPPPKVRAYTVGPALYYENIGTIGAIERELAERWMGRPFYEAARQRLERQGAGGAPDGFGFPAWLRDFRHAVAQGLYDCLRRGDTQMARLPDVYVTTIPAALREHVSHPAFTGWLAEKGKRQERYRGETGRGGFFA